MERSASQRAAAELVGTAFLLLAVVGSGIMAQRLSDDAGLQLLENAFATAATLYVLIALLGPVSGAHFNPAVTLWARIRGDVGTSVAAVYVVAQVVGGVAGTVGANVMFELPTAWSTTQRVGTGTVVAEVVATFGLVLVIAGLVRAGQERRIPGGVAAYIAGAYWFTSSTSFANPAVTLARTLTDSFAGIHIGSVLPYVAAQVVGALLAIPVARLLFPNPQA
ncbi:MAG: aquaporin [Myxococcota bacterium]